MKASFETQEKWDSFWGHLDELRLLFIRSLWIFFFVFFLLLPFHKEIIDFLVKDPYQNKTEGLSIRQIQHFEVINDSDKERTLRFSDELPSKTLNPGEHFVYQKTIHSPLLLFGPTEGFLIAFKVSFWVSLLLTTPILGVLFFRFISPGLLPGEKALFYPFFILSLLAVLGGIVFAKKITLPLTTSYLAFFNEGIGQNAWSLIEYIDYLLILCVGHVFAAEAALLLLVLVHFQLISSQQLKNKRKGMLLFFLIFGAFTTPPDVLSQLLVACPLIGIYELSIFYASWREKKAGSRMGLPL